MDKRVLKPKKNIKNTLIALIKEQSFDSISVVDICEKALTSRITFYSYYENKQALIEEILEDYMQATKDTFYRLQSQTSQEKNPQQEYENLLNAILEELLSDIPFFKKLSPIYNPSLFSSFFNLVYKAVHSFMERPHKLKLVYPVRQTAALICSGFLSVIAISTDDGNDVEYSKEITRKMYRSILSSELFTNV